MQLKCSEVFWSRNRFEKHVWLFRSFSEVVWRFLKLSEGFWSMSRRSRARLFRKLTQIVFASLCCTADREAQCLISRSRSSEKEGERWSRKFLKFHRRFQAKPCFHWGWAPKDKARLQLFNYLYNAPKHASPMLAKLKYGLVVHWIVQDAKKVWDGESETAALQTPIPNPRMELWERTNDEGTEFKLLKAWGAWTSSKTANPCSLMASDIVMI